MPTFDEWLARSGTELTGDQLATLDTEGALYGVTPESDLPVRHRNGVVELGPEKQRLLDQSNGWDAASRFKVWWELGMFDASEPVEVGLAREFVERMAREPGLDHTLALPPDMIATGITRAIDDTGFVFTDAPAPAPATCNGVCNVTINHAGGQSAAKCWAYSHTFDQELDSKPSATYESQVSVNCVFAQACAATLSATIQGPYALATAEAQGGSSINDITKGASWSTGLSVAGKGPDTDKILFEQSLDFVIGSKTSGSANQTTTGAVTANSSNSGSADIDPKAGVTKATVVGIVEARCERPDHVRVDAALRADAPDQRARARLQGQGRKRVGVDSGEAGRDRHRRSGALGLPDGRHDAHLGRDRRRGQREGLGEGRDGDRLMFRARVPL